MNATAEVRALREAVRQLHSFIVDELDPNPMRVGAYINDPAAQAAATRACQGRTIAQPIPKGPEW